MNIRMIMNIKSIVKFSFIFLFCLMFFMKQAGAATIKKITVNELVDEVYVFHHGAEYHAFFLLVSWCPVCQKSLLEASKLHKDHFDKLNVIFIAIDRNLDKLTKLAEQLSDEVTIYYLDNDDEIFQLFDYFQIQYKGKIPHFMLLRKGSNKPIIDGINDIRYFRTQFEKLAMVNYGRK